MPSTNPETPAADEMPPGLMFIGRRIAVVHGMEIGADGDEGSVIGRYNWLHDNLPHRFTLRTKTSGTGINLIASIAEISSGIYAIERVSYLTFLWFEQEEDAVLFKLHHSDLLASIFDATGF